MTFKFKTELFAVPYSDLRLVCSCSHDGLAISCCCETIACFWKLKVLDELDAGEDLFVLERCLALLALI